MTVDPFENHEILKLSEAGLTDVETVIKRLISQSVDANRFSGEVEENLWRFTIDDTTIATTYGNNNSIDVEIGLYENLTSSRYIRPYILTRYIKDQDGTQGELEFYALYFGRRINNLVAISKIGTFDFLKNSVDYDELTQVIMAQVQEDIDCISAHNFRQNPDDISIMSAIIEKLVPHITTREDIINAIIANALSDLRGE